MGKETGYHIQKAAIPLFKEKGFRNVTIEDICLAAGITKSTFYYHFESKDLLVMDFFENIKVMSPRLMQVLATSANCWEQLWACLEPAVDWAVSAGPALLSQVFISNIDNQVSGFTMFKEGELAELYICIIEKGQQADHFGNKSEAALIQQNIKNIMVGIAVQWCISGGRFDEKQAIKDCIASMLSVRKDLL